MMLPEARMLSVISVLRVWRDSSAFVNLGFVGLKYSGMCKWRSS